MFTRYPDATVCRISGRHASRYLQNRLSNNIRQLVPGGSCLEAAALTPQGKVGALVSVYAEAADSFLLVADGGNTDEIIKSILQFKVAEQFECANLCGSYAVIHSDGIPIETLRNIVGKSSICFSLTRFSKTGQHCLVPLDTVLSIIASLTKISIELSGDALTLARILNGILSFPEEINDQVLLSEVNEQRYVSFTKGCYVGQEVVAKIDALGRAPRRIIRFRASAESLISNGDSITASNQSRAVGSILTTVLDPVAEERVGFAILRNDPSILSAALHAGVSPISLWEAQPKAFGDAAS